MTYKTLDLNFSDAYSIYIGTHVLAEPFLEFCKTRKECLVLITDAHLLTSLGLQVKQLLLDAGLRVELLAIPAGEAHKTRETKAYLEDLLFAKGYGRDTCLLALGGGMVTDLVGFVAATYCRGVPVVYLPTTLLAMVDASIGGKTGVDTPYGKNLVGTFYQPKAVFMDLAVLETLPEREWRNGVVEMLKHGLIADAQFFEMLRHNVAKINGHDWVFLTEIIYQSCQIKKAIIERDERDYGQRQLLNFGHTIGHALELMDDYRIAHGEAVAIGMVVEAYLSALCGFLPYDKVTLIDATLRAFGVPLKTSAFNDLSRLMAVLSLDKKALAKTPYFVLLAAVGEAQVKEGKFVHAVAPELLQQALDFSKDHYSE